MDLPVGLPQLPGSRATKPLSPTPRAQAPGPSASLPCAESQHIRLHFCHLRSELFCQETGTQTHCDSLSVTSEETFIGAEFRGNGGGWRRQAVQQPGAHCGRRLSCLEWVPNTEKLRVQSLA